MRAALRRLVVARAPRLALRILRLDRAELGVAGEALAAAALRRAGWTLAGRRVRTPLAEVDLVARAPGLVVCVEVKTSRGPTVGPARWRPGDRLGPRSLARQRGAARWLAARLGAPTGRVDLIEVRVDHRGRSCLQHHEDLDRPTLP